MTLIVQSSDEDMISPSARLINVLNLPEGDEIKIVIDGQMLRITPPPTLSNEK